MEKCGALRDLVPFAQFKKREKHPRRSVNFSKVAGFNVTFLNLWFSYVFRGYRNVTLKPATLIKLTLLHGCFSRFLHCTNGTKSCNASQICLSHTEK